MKKIPSIVAVEIPSSDTRIIHMKIDADLFWFQGHFATFPILPGVAQMEWVMLFSEQYFGEQLDFGGVVRLKFQQPIVPQEEITLELKYLRGGSITFQYHHEDSLKSSGRIKLQ